MAVRTTVPEIGLHSAKQYPGVAQRRVPSARSHRVRICRDNRAYVVFEWTIPGVVTATSYGPNRPIDRDYWVARIAMSVGRHDSATHPNDGTPAGTDLTANLRRVTVNLASDDPILNSNSRLRITDNKHRDAVNDGDDGHFTEGDFNIKRLGEGELVYPVFPTVGSTRPGTAVVVSLVCVPIP